MSNSTGSRWITFLLLGLIAVMAVEIGFLIVENSRLRSLLDQAHGQFEPLTAGSRAPALSGQDIAGAAVVVRYGDNQPSTLLFCFSPSCDACEGNVSFWNEVAGAADPSRLRCVGLCAGMVDEAKAYAQAENIRYPVLSITDDRLWKSLHGEALPQTILIGPDGTVNAVWMGTLEAAQREEISRITADLRRKDGDLESRDSQIVDSSQIQPH